MRLRNVVQGLSYLCQTPMTSCDRPLEIATFLDKHGWSEATIESVAADFSPRRYARLTRSDKTTSVLMDADADQKTIQFVAIDKILCALGIRAPEIYGADGPRGLVLMEDFGRKNVGQLIDQGAEPRPFFIQAVDLLAHLHRNFERSVVSGLDLPHYDVTNFLSQVELFLDVYLPFARGREATEEERQDFHAAWLTVLRPIETMPKSLMLRDFMPDNLMALADGSLGVLDFQEAGVGPIVYDLASLCEEARRDGGFTLLKDVITHYCSIKSVQTSEQDLLRGCTILSSLRHTRTLGNFARAALRKGMQAKLELLPRIRAHVWQTLSEPYLFPVAEWMSRVDI